MPRSEANQSALNLGQRRAVALQVDVDRRPGCPVPGRNITVEALKVFQSRETDEIIHQTAGFQVADLVLDGSRNR